ncbi:MAG: nodulation protein NfeD, partial [Candidatus Omnitrophica bacterium]|nr:nodulation protein NfeD [Candidatus Omnitrophota bacterium]MBD3269081.1 nodulation protein NfeD [Candidatus Omnitrophota bacterium]
MRKLFAFLLIFLLGFCLAGSADTVKILTIKDYIINPVTYEYISENLKKAEKENCPALIIRINTPGGLLKSTQDITKEILNSEIPVITYVWPKGGRAASAGTFIGYSSSILAMAPSTHIGAAHPVVGQGSWGEVGEKLQEKMMNDTLAWAKNISRQRNRPYRYLREMVEESKSFTEEEALRRGIIDLVAQDTDTLIRGIDSKTFKLKDAEVVLNIKDADKEFIELSFRQKILNVLLHPNLAYLLFTLGFLGLVFEVTHPGFGFPGIAGIICIITAFYAFSVLPVNYAGVIFIILGLVFLVIETVTPTFGLFAGAGVVSFVMGSLFLFRGPPSLKVSLSFIIPLTVVAVFWNVFIVGKILQIRLV